MQGIKPDTSLYTDTPSRLEALAKTLRCHGDDQVLEERASNSAEWVPANGHAKLFCKRMAEGWDFRIKPEPRQLWKLAIGSDYFRADYPTRAQAEEARATMSATYAIVRFVGQPE